MQEIISIVTNYGISMIIVCLFIWDWITNRKVVTDTLKEMAATNANIEKCLVNMEQHNENVSKYLDLLNKAMESQDWKLDKLLER